MNVSDQVSSTTLWRPALRRPSAAGPVTSSELNYWPCLHEHLHWLLSVCSAANYRRIYVIIGRRTQLLSLNCIIFSRDVVSSSLASPARDGQITPVLNARNIQTTTKRIPTTNFARSTDVSPTHITLHKMTFKLIHILIAEVTGQQRPYGWSRAVCKRTASVDRMSSSGRRFMQTC